VCYNGRGERGVLRVETRRFRIDEDSKQSIIDALTVELSRYEEIVFAYLHGSFAGSGPFRDIDVAIFVKEDPPPDPLEMRNLYEISIESRVEKAVGFPVDVRVLNDAPLSFRYAVIRDGRLLLCRDDQARTEFQGLTLDLYFDFLPFRNRYLQEVFGWNTMPRS